MFFVYVAEKGIGRSRNLNYRNQGSNSPGLNGGGTSGGGGGSAQLPNWRYWKHPTPASAVAAPGLFIVNNSATRSSVQLNDYLVNILTARSSANPQLGAGAGFPTPSASTSTATNSTNASIFQTISQMNVSLKTKTIYQHNQIRLQ